MSIKQWLKSTCAALAATSMAAGPALAAMPDVVMGQKSSAAVMALASNPSHEALLPHLIKQALLRKKIKYVFVIFQENRSFDHYFGTFPGVDGLINNPNFVLGSTQKIVNVDGTVGTISPFLIPQTVKDVNGNTVPLYPADTGSVDHSQSGINNGIDFDSSLNAHNDRYSLNAEKLTTNAAGQIVSLATGVAATANPTLVQKQFAELVVSHIDCDTIPFLWQYADRFALFDAFHQTVIGPSTPNAIAMIAGQSGLTQWALHPSQSTNVTTGIGKQGVPIFADPGPFAGSNLDPSPVKPPYNPGDENPAAPAINNTYASLPLTFMGGKIKQVVAQDQNPTVDLADVQNDITLIAGENLPPTNWAWYELGYDNEPLDPTNTTPSNPHSDYIIHHEGPQYFGYIADNAGVAQQHLFGQGKFYSDIANNALPAGGGVFYVRGGYGNIDGLKPVDPNPKFAVSFAGNDDHPAYSDAQISEASVADTVNAIAHSKYWDQSAIVITYDETDGLWDHQAIKARALDPSGNPIEQGPRIPAIVISPYGRSHVIVHQPSEHGSVIKFIDEMFGLNPLADLPDELIARYKGYTQLGQYNLGPSDDPFNGLGDLFPAFDDARLLGLEAPLPASYAEIDPTVVRTLPHYGNLGGCHTLAITPTDYKPDGTVVDPAPADFNPRPSQSPGTPTSGTWTP